jgi:hypothetical protein
MSGWREMSNWVGRPFNTSSKDQHLTIRWDQKMFGSNPLRCGILTQPHARYSYMIECIHMGCNNDALRSGFSNRDCLRGIHDDQNLLTPHCAARMRDDNLRLCTHDDLSHGVIPNGISCPVYGGFVRSLKDEARCQTHFG